MNTILRRSQWMFAVVLLAACAQLGLPTPQGFNEKLAVGYGTVTQVRETATALLQQRKISSDDAVNVQASADVARVGLDTARALHASDPAAADAKLTAIKTSLTALTTYLAARGGK